MNLFADVLSRIATAVSILVLVAVLFLAGPKLFGIDPYIVESGSMEPVIPTGSIAYINTRDTDVTPGDIVTFYIGETDKLATHRIVRKEHGQFFTKGDANDDEDIMPLRQDQIVGTYAYCVPKAGYLLAKQQKLIPVLAFWIIGLNLFSMVAHALAQPGVYQDS